MAMLRASLLKHQARYEPLIASQQERALYRNFSLWRDEYLRLLESARTAVNSPLQPDNTDVLNAYRKIRPALEALIDLNVEGAALVDARADAVYAQSIRWLGITVAISIALALLLIVLLDTRISRPLRRLAMTAGRISQGDLTARAQLNSAQDELGDLARTFDHMAVALQHRELEAEQAEQDLARRYAQLQAIYRLTQAVQQSSSIDDLYQAALGALRDTLHTTYASVLLLDEHAGMRFVAWHGLSDKYRKQAAGHNPWATDADVQPITVADVTQEASLSSLQEAFREQGIGALAFIPLLYQKRLLGKFMLYYHCAHVFSTEEVQLAQSIASHVAVAMERTRQSARLEHQALYDSLTDIPNRTLLYDRLRQEIIVARRVGESLALLLIDLDRFKEINDTLGHHQGDQILKQVAERVQRVLRLSDTVARLGGDEFALLLPSVENAAHAMLTADKILKVLREPFKLGGIEVEVDASIGIVLCPEHGVEVDLLMQHVDVAMYTAKRQGCGYAVYAPESDPHTPQRLTLVGELRQAIEHHQLELYYQPKLTLGTGRVVGTEALVRWQHPQRGLLYPDQFIFLAEQTGLIRPLALWVIGQALRQHTLWRAQGMDVQIAVNLSARNLHDEALPGQVAELLHKHQAAPGSLEMEITESAIMQDPARALEVLAKLSGMGVKLSIDDFGTGYSSLTYLGKLPVDAVKIDKSFILSMDSDADSAMIVRTIIDIAHNMGMQVIAEGVEQSAVMEQLAQLGCDVTQGYYIHRPVTADDFALWMNRPT